MAKRNTYRDLYEKLKTLERKKIIFRVVKDRKEARNGVK